MVLRSHGTILPLSVVFGESQELSWQLQAFEICPKCIGNSYFLFKNHCQNLETISVCIILRAPLTNSGTEDVASFHGGVKLEISGEVHEMVSLMFVFPMKS